MRVGVIALSVVLLGCGSTPIRRPRTNVAPPSAATGALSVEANRNAPPPAPGEAGEDELATLVLWCSQPGGRACRAAEQELGLAPTPAEAIPNEIREQARDLEDDCSDPEIGPLMQRLTTAIGAGGSWVDHLGQLVDTRAIADMFSGSGCTNAPGPTDAVVKLHAATTEAGVRILVRVWEVGEP